MSKPIVFFSHSSKDKETLIKLKEMYCEKTGGAIDVFLSSDGQSIPFGKNWVHRVEEALRDAEIMVVFVTPAALRSEWLYFEAGYAYSKGIRVVPVGFMGVDLSQLRPPLSLLQGFNIVSKDGLDNLIALTNDVFKHEHNLRFTEDDFRELLPAADAMRNHPFGEHLPLVSRIVVEVTEKTGLNCDAETGLECAAKVLEQEDVEFRWGEKKVRAFGMSISISDGLDPRPLGFYLDPYTIDSAIPLVGKILGKICNSGLEGVRFRLEFLNHVQCEEALHNITGRLSTTEVRFGSETSLLFRSLQFTISHLRRFTNRGGTQRGATCLLVTPTEDKLDPDELGSLLDILFDRRVLYVRAEDWSSSEVLWA